MGRDARRGPLNGGESAPSLRGTVLCRSYVDRAPQHTS
ncbi:hypothetical protein KCH_49090 [Kitasatospora cheerisanensis KCTC 2395]|uniref:Uncharacterized protein n=1 Tax=Kitasatospora cheerisanensis KCTC 2395 TaxID=1348663 RepID=A0A066YQ95_9ACTN|nr:hypothetical protein KCH_49090 [Kitasatospora cheerisanensis KCTC 2395]